MMMMMMMNDARCGQAAVAAAAAAAAATKRIKLACAVHRQGLYGVASAAQPSARTVTASIRNLLFNVSGFYLFVEL